MEKCSRNVVSRPLWTCLMWRGCFFDIPNVWPCFKILWAHERYEERMGKRRTWYPIRSSGLRSSSPPISDVFIPFSFSVLLFLKNLSSCVCLYNFKCLTYFCQIKEIRWLSCRFLNICCMRKDRMWNAHLFERKPQHAILERVNIQLIDRFVRSIYYDLSMFVSLLIADKLPTRGPKCYDKIPIFMCVPIKVNKHQISNFRLIWKCQYTYDTLYNEPYF